MYDLTTLIVSIISASKEPVSGYDIAKIVKSKTGNSTQHVYRALKGVATIDGIVINTVEQDGRPNKKTYQLGEGLSLELDREEMKLCDDEFSKSETGYLLASYDALNGTDLLGDFLSKLSNARLNAISQIGG